MKQTRLISSSPAALSAAAIILRQGGIIAYPTEAVYGLGCDPNNEVAIKQVRILKHRPTSKGFILIAADWQQLMPYVELQSVKSESLTEVLHSWPGPFTWVFPASEHVSPLISGEEATVAVRVTSHPIACGLCEAFGGAIVSTSANMAGHPPARNAEELQQIFPEGIELVVNDLVGNLAQPTQIRDVRTGKILRGVVKLQT